MHLFVGEESISKFNKLIGRSFIFLHTPKLDARGLNVRDSNDNKIKLIEHLLRTIISTFSSVSSIQFSGHGTVLPLASPNVAAPMVSLGKGMVLNILFTLSTETLTNPVSRGTV